MVIELWLLGTAVIFTGVGIYFARSKQKDDVHQIVEHVMDDLILKGYVKSMKDEKGEVEILKWWEEFPKEVDSETK